MSEEKQPVSIYEAAAMAIEQFAAFSWQKLGLQPDFVTGQIHVNLPEAKVAIDLVSNLVNCVESELDDDDRRQMEGLLANLRINYVKKSREAQEAQA